MQKMNDQDLSASLVQDLLKEKRRDRLWRNIRSLAWLAFFAYLLINIFYYVSHSSMPSAALSEQYVALIRLDGMIAPDRDFSAAATVPLLEEAFADKNALGVILDINSPGGTPVQAAIIHDSILRLKNKYHKKIVVVGEDLLTSGAYFVAVAADRIYVNPSTLTGSIGVAVKGFGFVDAMKKLGIERRVYTAGNEKDRLDPFLPQSPDDIKKISEVMHEVHQYFVNAVLKGRKGKLTIDPSKLFNGDFWSGQTAISLGLADAAGNLNEASEKEFHSTEFKEYNSAPNFFRLLSGQLNTALDAIVYL
jgi:protease IV